MGFTRKTNLKKYHFNFDEGDRDVFSDWLFTSSPYFMFLQIEVLIYVESIHTI